MDDLLPPIPRFWSRTKIASACVSVVYIVIAAIFLDWVYVMKLSLFLTVPIMCIWFPEVMSKDDTANTSTGVPPPAGCIASLGWFVLFLPLVQFGIILVGILR